MSRPAKRELRLPVTVPETARIYLRPVGLTCGKAAEKLAAAGTARRLAGGPWFFAACELVLRAPATGVRRATAALGEIESWADRLETPLRDRLRAQLDRLVAPRLAPDGGPLTRPLIMAVIDMTPGRDADIGDPFDPAAAVATGHRLAGAGADVIEVASQSARLGAAAVTPHVEAERILPVIRGLDALAGITIAIDTRHTEVAVDALAAGATMISDGAVLAGTPASKTAMAVLRARDGVADAMEAQEERVFDLFDGLEAQLEAKLTAGAARAQLVVDPRFSSAGEAESSVSGLKDLALFHGLGCPVLFTLPSDSVGEHQHHAATLGALDQGIQILRTQKVSETRQVVDLWERLIASGK